MSCGGQLCYDSVGFHNYYHEGSSAIALITILHHDMEFTQNLGQPPIYRLLFTPSFMQRYPQGFGAD